MLVDQQSRLFIFYLGQTATKNERRATTITINKYQQSALPARCRLLYQIGHALTHVN